MSYLHKIGLLLLSVILTFLTFPSFSQELKCMVSVNYSQLPVSNRTHFENMQKAMTDFISNRRWTDLEFSSIEKIECSIQLTLTAQAGTNEYIGVCAIQLKRPIYGSGYKSTTFNMVDENILFKYIDGEEMIYDERSFKSNLVALLSYYAYIFIGFDMDTYARMGGTPYFKKAQSVVDASQLADGRGWKPYEGKYQNRYWLVNNLLSPAYAPVREASYMFYRQGFDLLADNFNTGKTNIFKSFNLIRDVARATPDPYLFLIKVYLSGKVDEICSIFAGSNSDYEKKQVNQTMIEIDPTNSAKYAKILVNPSTAPTQGGQSQGGANPRPGFSTDRPDVVRPGFGK